MLKGAIARRYAVAIFDIARRQNTIDPTLDDVQNINQLFAHRTLAYLLREPKVPLQRKETALRKSLTSRVLPTSLNLALLLVQRGLVEAAPNIASELESLILDYRNQARAQVTTAAPLDPIQSESVRQTLEHQTGKTIIMTTRIDPAILGGLIAQVGDEVVDGSVRNRLHVLQQQLLTGIASNDVSFSGNNFLSGDDNDTPAIPAPPTPSRS